jgi:hypothetical protein
VRKRIMEELKHKSMEQRKERERERQTDRQTEGINGREFLAAY